jgi:hypothetical protein
MKTDELFLKELAESREAVNKFAVKCRADGIDVWVFPEQTRPDHTQWKKYADSGDLMVQGRVEHKTRKKIQFTSQEDYPYRTVFVCEKRREEDRPPLAYVIQSADEQHAAVVYGWTRDKWVVERVYDKKSRKSLDVFAVDKKYVRFINLSESRVF